MSTKMTGLHGLNRLFRAGLRFRIPNIGPNGLIEEGFQGSYRTLYSPIHWESSNKYVSSNVNTDKYERKNFILMN